MNTFASLFTASLAATLAISSAQAGILGFGARETSFTVTATASPVPLRNVDPATTITFRTARDNTLVAVTYNAECTAVSDIVGGRVEVRIAVDGFTQTQGFGFCSALVADLPVHSATSRRAVIRLPRAGLHTVRVFAKLTPGATFGGLDDSSIVIED